MLVCLISSLPYTTYHFFFFNCYGYHRYLHLRTHPFPPQRSSYLMTLNEMMDRNQRRIKSYRVISELVEQVDTFELVQLLLQADSFGNLHRFNAPQWAGKVERPETLFHESNLTPERYPSLVEQTRTWVESILEILDRESRIAMRP